MVDMYTNYIQLQGLCSNRGLPAFPYHVVFSIILEAVLLFFTCLMSNFAAMYNSLPPH